MPFAAILFRSLPKTRFLCVVFFVCVCVCVFFLVGRTDTHFIPPLLGSRSTLLTTSVCFVSKRDRSLPERFLAVSLPVSFFFLCLSFSTSLSLLLADDEEIEDGDGVLLRA